jgi:hypothetical protein
MANSLLSRLTPYAVLLGGVLLFFRRVLLSREYIIPFDLAGYHLPLAHYAAMSLGAGRLPLWDPYTYCGLPFYANPQAQTFYPPAWIVFALANLLGFDKMLWLLQWEVGIHVFIGGAGAYLLLRRLGVDRLAAVFAGTVYQLGGFFAAQAQHLGAVCGAAWLPFAWLAVIQVCEKPCPRRTAVLAAVLALVMLAGFPAMFIVVAASSWLLALALAAWRQASFRALIAVSVASAWSLPLAAVQLLPTRELIPLSQASLRWQWGDDAGGVPWQGLVSLVAPNYFDLFDPSRYKLPWNPAFLYLYCGLAAGALARRDRLAGLFATLTLAAGLAMMGGSTPAGRSVLHALPPSLKSPLYPEFFSAAFILGVASLAALGAARWITRRGVVWGAALIVLTIADLVWTGSNRFWNTQSAAEAAPATERSFEGSAETLAGVRRLVNQTSPAARIDVRDDSVNWAHHAPLLRIPTANGNDPLVISRLLAVRRLFAPGNAWERYHEVSRLDSPVLDLLNVRYLLTYAPDAALRIQHPKFRLAANLPGHQAYENLAVLPRFFLVGETRRAGSPGEAIEMLRSPGFDPRRVAVVEGVEALAGAAGSVRVEYYSAGGLALETEAAAPSFLVTSETWYPGWRATVDGREQPLVMTNGAFRGLPLPPGRHRVEMRFAPAILWWGAALSAAGCLLLGWALWKRPELGTVSGFLLSCGPRCSLT